MVHLQPYEAPQCFIYNFNYSDILCVSGPEPGSNEDVGYEDWTI